jgi:glycosyltransferase involved in cell wall biosynthesis
MRALGRDWGKIFRMAQAGLPVVASRCDGIPEDVVDGLITALRETYAELGFCA